VNLGFVDAKPVDELPEGTAGPGVDQPRQPVSRPTQAGRDVVQPEARLARALASASLDIAASGRWDSPPLGLEAGRWQVAAVQVMVQWSRGPVLDPSRTAAECSSGKTALLEGPNQLGPRHRLDPEKATDGPSQFG
jgi:hypothetical protein